MAPIPPTPSASAIRYAITNVSVIDVENGIAVPAQMVFVAGERIDQISTAGEVEIPPGAEIIEGQGLYLIPGLTDAHVHYFEAPLYGRLMIANGILLVRDMGMPNEYILELRDALNRGETLGPEMAATGRILDGDPPMIPAISIGVTTPEQGRAAVNQQAAAGADMIKVYSTLDKDVFLAIADEAQKLGLPVVGHIPDSIYIEEAAAAGLRSSEHWFGFEKAIASLLGETVVYSFNGMGSGMDYLRRLGEIDPQARQDFYQRLSASGLVVTPTVVLYKVFPDIDAFEAGDIAHSEYVSPNLLSIWKSQWSGQRIPEFVWQSWASMVADLNAAGVPLMVGTDLMCPGIIPGYSAHAEMAIWQQAGIPAADVLRSATLVPAQFMGLGDRLGSLRVGNTASMVLVRANPLDDIRNAQLIEAVFLRGAYYDRQALDQMLAEAEELARNSTP